MRRRRSFKQKAIVAIIKVKPVSLSSSLTTYRWDHPRRTLWASKRKAIAM